MIQHLICHNYLLWDVIQNPNEINTEFTSNPLYIILKKKDQFNVLPHGKLKKAGAETLKEQNGDQAIQCQLNDSPWDIAREFSEKNTNYAVVFNKNHIAGIITRNDITQLVNNMLDSKNNQPKTRDNEISYLLHDVRTPLNTILGFSKYLSRGEKEANKKRMANIIHESAQMLHGLLDDYMLAQKINSDEIDLHAAYFDLYQTIEHLNPGFALKCKEKGLVYTCINGITKGQLLYGDKLKVTRIIINLTNNAIKYTQEGAVTINFHEKKNIDQSIDVYFTVEDTGMGIKEEEQQKIFEKYYRSDDINSRKTAGMGLGLSNVKYLTNLMGGQVDLKSKYGEGSVFSVQLPFPAAKLKNKDPLDKDERTKEVNPAISNKKLRLLIVEDDHFNRKLLSMQLVETNWDLTLAGNGFEALNAINTEEFDIIFMDVHMPDLNGFEVIRIVREMDIDTPIVIISGTSMNKKDLGDADIQGFATKPLNKKGLFNLVRSIIEPKNDIPHISS